jgi:amino acid permease
MKHSQSHLSHEYLYSWTLFTIITLITNYVIIFPLSLFESLHKFRYISVIAMVAIVYVAVILLLDLPKYYEANYKPGIIEQADWEFISFL